MIDYGWMVGIDYEGGDDDYVRMDGWVSNAEMIMDRLIKNR